MLRRSPKVAKSVCLALGVKMDGEPAARLAQKRAQLSGVGIASFSMPSRPAAKLLLQLLRVSRAYGLRRGGFVSTRCFVPGPAGCWQVSPRIATKRGATESHAGCLFVRFDRGRTSRLSEVGDEKRAEGRGKSKSGLLHIEVLADQGHKAFDTLETPSHTTKWLQLEFTT